MPSRAADLAQDPAPSRSGRRRRDDQVNWVSAIPFLAVNAVPLLIVVTGVSRRAVLLLLVTFFVRQFLITGGYHRYFSHRTYRMSRLPQFLMAFGGTTAAQKGPLWWAAHHRTHHRFADTENDPHTPRKGFWWSHVGWILCDRYCETDLEKVSDFARFPELRFINKHDWIGPWMLAVACFVIGGVQGLVVGFFLSTVLLWHTTFLINSLAHVIGRRAYVNDDDSRNSAGLAVLTLGEGWHNNHHHHPSSARLGFRWWQWDPTFYVITGLSWLGLVRDVRVVPPRAVLARRVAQGDASVDRISDSELRSRSAHPAGGEAQAGQSSG